MAMAVKNKGNKKQCSMLTRPITKQS